MKELITTNPLFGITLTILCYKAGMVIGKKTGKAICNPFLITVLIIIAILFIFDIPFSAYEEGGVFINLFLGPVTAVLAYSIYRQRETVKAHFVSILAGTIAGSISAVAVILLLASLLGLDDTLSASLVPKSVTTPIAIAISEAIGGVKSLTVTSLILTGVLGNMFAPFMIKLFRIKSRIAQGVAIGTASHVIGTSKAMELGEDIGAISGIALSFTGIITAIISLLFL